jgi:hypothetical protein
MVGLSLSFLRTVVAGPVYPYQSPTQADVPDDRAALVADPSENIGVTLFVVAKPDYRQRDDDPVGPVSARPTLQCHSPRHPLGPKGAPAGEGCAEEAPP